MKYLQSFTLATTLMISLVGCGETTEITSNQSKVVESQTQGSTPQERQMAELGDIMKEAQQKLETNPNMSEEEQKKVMMETINNSSVMKNQFEKQKALLPKIVDTMTFYRDCLSKANSKEDAQKCEKKGRALAQKVGLNEVKDEEENKEAWTKDGREELVEELTREINSMKTALPCIEKAKNMSDFIQCSPQPLE